MRCPFCQNDDTRVIDSRLTDDRHAVRRRRECEACEERFSTLEEANLKLPYIVKSNGDREHYDESKLARGLERALEKRPVESDQIEQILHRIKRNLLTGGEREVQAREVGEFVMNYVRSIRWLMCALHLCIDLFKMLMLSVMKYGVCRNKRCEAVEHPVRKHARR